MVSDLSSGTLAEPAGWSESAGVETLRRMLSVDRYNRWIFQRLAGYVGTRVLEVGCGIGNMTPFFLDGAEVMTCIDVIPESIAFMAAEFAADSRIQPIAADISDPQSLGVVGRCSYDTVVCINVLEHIEYDDDAVGHMHDALGHGGLLLLFVPAGKYLYGTIDEAVGHYRRYSAEPLRQLVEDRGFEVVELFHMNVMGVLGWYLSGKILGRQVPPHGLLRLFNWLTPGLIRFEKLVNPGFGLSLVCVARRVD